MASPSRKAAPASASRSRQGTAPTAQSSRRPRKKSPQERLFSQRYPNVDDLPVVHPHPAAIDIGGKRSHFVAVGVGAEVEIREFGMDTDQLLELARYLQELGVEHVAMESTGVYWVPLYDVLEERGQQVCLTNPSHSSNVPGRQKTDKMDCRWLRKLHLHGLLSPSFRPAHAIRPVRSLLRHRTRLVQESADYLRRLQKVLDMMNVRPHKVLSDLGGETGMAILRAIVAGERDPAVLAKLRHPRCEHTEGEFRAALKGFYRRHYVEELGSLLRLYDALSAELRHLDGVIEEYLQELAAKETKDSLARLAADTHAWPDGKHAPHFNAAGYVGLITGRDPTLLPGIGPQSALELFAELGSDMSPWPTERHFCSYLTLAPNLKISGGKVLSSKTRPGTCRAAVIFRQAAAAVIQKRDCALAAYYRQLAPRIGKGKALTAVAHKLALLYYRLMKEGHAYVEQGERAYEERYQQRRLAWLKKQAERLNYRLEPVAT